MGVLINLLLIPVVLFYVLRDWPLFLSRLEDMIPRRLHPTVAGITREIDAVLPDLPFVAGQRVAVLISGLLDRLGWALPWDESRIVPLAEEPDA